MALIGALRLSGSALRTMPRNVALLTVVAGASVVVFGVAFARISSTNVAPPPRVALEPVGSAAPDSTDVIYGRVIRPGGRPVSAVTVALRPTVERGTVRRTRTDTDGAFSFAGTGVGPGSPFVAEARFGGTTFPSEVLRSPRPLDAPVRIVVAPTTRSAKRISVGIESVALVGDEDGVQALHVLTVRNTGSRAYIGGLHLGLLPNGTAVDPGSGLVRRFLSLEDGEMISRAPVLPGNTDITYTYVAPMQNERLNARYGAPYATRRFELLVGKGLHADASGRLKDTGSVRIGGPDEERTYQRLAAGDLAKGDVVHIRVGVQKENTALQIGGIAAAIVLSLSLIGYPIFRRRRRDGTPTDEPSPVEVR